MRSGKVAPLNPSQISVSEQIHHTEQSILSGSILHEAQTKHIPKIKLHPFLFLLNITWMVTALYFSIYYIFSTLEPDKLRIKGILAASSCVLILIVALYTFSRLTNLKQLLRLMFLLDNIMVASIVAVIVFINLILIFDKGDNWHYPMIQSVFTTIIVCYSTIVRVMLVCMDWTKWQLIVFKIHLITNSIMFFTSGVYFVLIDFSYTSHQMKQFDNQVYDYMVLFYFTMFAWIYEMFSKTTDLDFTGELKFVYRVKSVDQNRQKRKKEFITQKKKTFKSIKSLFIVQSLENYDV